MSECPSLSNCFQQQGHAGGQTHLSTFQKCATLAALFLVPAMPDVHKSRIVRWLCRRVFTPRLYFVGWIARLSARASRVAVASSAASAIVSYLAIWKISRLRMMPPGDMSYLLSCFRDSPSQFGQDALALLLCGNPNGATFIEAGACDGYFSSNTWILETNHGWTGVLCEPARVWIDVLKSSRHSIVDARALWRISGEKLLFSETESPNLSTLETFTEADNHASSRRERQTYQVESVSLLDLLRRHDMPQFIHFVSLDTEGSELEILRDFPFHEYSFGVLVCEHNNGPNRKLIENLLENVGFTYLQELSAVLPGDSCFVGPKFQGRLDELRTATRTQTARKSLPREISGDRLLRNPEDLISPLVVLRRLGKHWEN